MIRAARIVSEAPRESLLDRLTVVSSNAKEIVSFRLGVTSLARSTGNSWQSFPRVFETRSIKEEERGRGKENFVRETRRDGREQIFVRTTVPSTKIDSETRRSILRFSIILLPSGAPAGYLSRGKIPP